MGRKRKVIQNAFAKYIYRVNVAKLSNSDIPILFAWAGKKGDKVEEASQAEPMEG